MDSFAKKLARLRHAAALIQTSVAVQREDLRELLYHFDRLDSAARAEHDAKVNR